VDFAFIGMEWCGGQFFVADVYAVFPDALCEYLKVICRYLMTESAGPAVDRDNYLIRSVAAQSPGCFGIDYIVV